MSWFGKRQDELRRELGALASEMMVDISLGERQIPGHSN